MKTIKLTHILTSKIDQKVMRIGIKYRLHFLA